MLEKKDNGRVVRMTVILTETIYDWHTCSSRHWVWPSGNLYICGLFSLSPLRLGCFTHFFQDCLQKCYWRCPFQKMYSNWLLLFRVFPCHEKWFSYSVFVLSDKKNDGSKKKNLSHWHIAISLSNTGLLRTELSQMVCWLVIRYLPAWEPLKLSDMDAPSVPCLCLSHWYFL